jgi:hypothetical protein
MKNRAQRIHDEQTHISKQVKIAKQHGLQFNDKVIKEPHRLAKHHAMDCGNPKCFLCGNPRKTTKEVTHQEKKQMVRQMDLE